MKTADFWIEKLGLTRHPEGGYFKENYRSDDIVLSSDLPERYEKDRCLCTSIFYLLEGNDYSSFHRLKSDEIWHYYHGSSILIYRIDNAGKLYKERIGNDVESGDKLQLLIPHGQWFAAELMAKNSFGLAGCTVSPGFDFEDFELADRDILVVNFPEHKELIYRLT